MTQLLIPFSLDTGLGSRSIVVEKVSPAPRDIWQGVLRDDPGATALQTPEYVDAVVAATGGSDLSRFYQLRDGRQLVLPLVRRTRLGLHLDAGYPDGFGSGGMLATGGLLTDDVRTVVQDLQEEPVSLRIGGAHHTSEQWRAGLVAGVVEERRSVQVVDLAPGSAAGALAFPAETRAELERAVSLGVEVERDDTGRLVPICYDVYRACVEEWIPRSGLPPRIAHRRALRAEPYEKFLAVAAALGAGCRVFVARIAGRPVAVSVLLVHGQHAVRWRSYHIGDPAANLLLQVSSIEDAVRSGCRDLDLGPTIAAEDPAPARGLGASSRPVVDLRIESAGLARLRAARARAVGVLERARTRSPASPTLGQPMPNALRPDSGH